MTLADRIVVMRSGEIVQIGSPMETTPIRSILPLPILGSPSMNLLAAKSSKKNGSAQFRAASFEVALPNASRRRNRGPPRSAFARSMWASRSAATVTSSFRSDW